MQHVIVASLSGLHSRPAAIISTAARDSGASVTLSKLGSKQVNLTSTLALLSLGVAHGEEVTLTVEGEEAARILAELAALIEKNLDN
ncbi:HPr family phosphocarrier protein [Leifsonia kafniensis]|uniref:Phosphocarrier protein HPr n=1 Tax=Leifsonia kafniensis TaxID=475957 RepID=A0ABP7KKL1_9MICO